MQEINNLDFCLRKRKKKKEIYLLKVTIEKKRKPFNYNRIKSKRKFYFIRKMLECYILGNLNIKN